ncbi:MAG TPA: CsbD family protein [Chloroflexota bacterium]|nr:CsbD family protein [Chloroflexota bacterium]
MSDADKDRATGTIDQMKGQMEQTGGHLTGDEDVQAQGAIDKAQGKVEQGTGEMRDKAGETIKGE